MSLVALTIPPKKRRRDLRARNAQSLDRDRIDGPFDAVETFVPLVAASKPTRRNHSSAMKRTFAGDFIGAAGALHVLCARLPLGKNSDQTEHAHARSRMVKFVLPRGRLLYPEQALDAIKKTGKTVTAAMHKGKFICFGASIRLGSREPIGREVR